MEELTKKQRAILDYMKAHVAEHSYWPSIRDIQAKFRFASTNGVYGHLQALERKGVLQRIPGAARAYKIVPEVLGDTSETVIRYEGPGDDAIAFENVKFAGSIAAAVAPYRSLQWMLAVITLLGVGLFGAGSVWTARRVTQPLRRLVQQGERTRPWQCAPAALHWAP